MGIFDFIFGKPPKWLTVTKENFPDGSTLGKTDAKKYLALYLEQCGFDKPYVTEEKVELSEAMISEEEDLKEDINSEKENQKELKSSLSNLKKTKKDDEGNELNEEDLRNSIEDLNSDIKDSLEYIEEKQKELKELKSNWTGFLISYINDRAKEEHGSK